MKKYAKILFLAVLLWGSFALWKTGNACRMAVYYTMEKTFHDYGNDYPSYIEKDLESLKGSTVPYVCSKSEFDASVSDKFSEWQRTAEREEKMRHSSD